MRFATLVISVLLVWALPSAAAQAGVAEPAAAASAVQAKKPGLAKKRALTKALKKCGKMKKISRRKVCVRKAHKRFRAKPKKPVAPKPGALHRVDVMDNYFEDYFSPDYLEIKSGDSIEWIWNDMNQNPHNVSLVSGPSGVNRNDYATPNSPSRNYRWVRRFEKTGTYSFVCSIHFKMTMNVNVGK